MMSWHCDELSDSDKGSITKAYHLGMEGSKPGEGELTAGRAAVSKTVGCGIYIFLLLKHPSSWENTTANKSRDSQGATVSCVFQPYLCVRKG
jgi:hypothetical protein